MSAVHDELKQAQEAVRHAASSVADRILGTETRGHLRDAARHALRAGLAALDEADRRSQAPAKA